MGLFEGLMCFFKFVVEWNSYVVVSVVHFLRKLVD